MLHYLVVFIASRVFSDLVYYCGSFQFFVSLTGLLFVAAVAVQVTPERAIAGVAAATVQGCPVQAGAATTSVFAFFTVPVSWLLSENTDAAVCRNPGSTLFAAALPLVIASVATLASLAVFVRNVASKYLLSADTSHLG